MAEPVALQIFLGSVMNFRASNNRNRNVFLASAALGLILSSVVIATARADGGTGGASGGLPGGAGGAGTGGAAGADGTAAGSGGGGGATGTIGGPGGAGDAGDAGVAALGGAGGTSATQAGHAGTDGVSGHNNGGGGGGGGGGFDGPFGAGGNGGNGGVATSMGFATGGGGGGGGAGIGNGGNGGNGGDGQGTSARGTGGSGGNGGDSLFGVGGAGGNGGSGNGAFGTGGRGGDGGASGANSTFDVPVVIDIVATANGGAGGAGGIGGAAGAGLSNNATGGNGGNGGQGGIGFSGIGAAISLTNNNSLTGLGGMGGIGGAGGDTTFGGATSGSGGSGGNGGIGVSFVGGAASLINTGSATIAGGNGGIGANAGIATLAGATGVGGNGGRGGDGLSFTGDNARLINQSSLTIVGGAGGNGGSGGSDGRGGAGGNGVTFTGAGTTFSDSGSLTIVGGDGGSSTTAAGNGGVGILFSGPGASLTLSSLGVVVGGNGGTSGGAGGAAIQANGIVINNAGLIVGGRDGGGGPQVFGIVLTGGTNAIGGNGIITGGIQVQAGSLAPALPGSAVGTDLHVSGPISFSPGSTFAVRINGALSDSISSSGDVTVAGASVATTIQSFVLGHRYTIISSGGAGVINGTFASGGMSSAFLSTVLSYDVTHVYETITGNGANGNVDFTTVAQTVNQLNVATALNTAGNSNGFSGPLLSLIEGLSVSQARAGFNMIDGEVATGTQQTTFNAMNQFMNVMTDPFVAGRGDPVSAGGTPTAYADESLAYAARVQGRPVSERNAYAAMVTKAPVAPLFEQRWSVWAAGYGGSQITNGNAVVGSNDTRSSIFGTAVGADYRFSPDTIAGFALAGGGTNFSVNGLGSGRSDLFQAGAFIRHNVGPAYITAALAYGWQDITTDRTVTLAGVDRLRAEFNANAWSGRLEGGYRFVAPIVGGVGITPYAAGQFTTFDLPAYAEGVVSGAPLFALSYASKSVTDTRSELGIHTDKSFATENGIFTLRGRFAWAHDFDPDRSIGATFQSLPGASFVVNGAAQASDSALTTASAEWKWINGWSAAATFEGEFSNVTQSYAGKGVVRYSW